MYNIQLNESGTRNMNVTEQNLQTIQKYLCFDVIYHDKMKAFGLKNLIAAFNEWQTLQPTETENEAE